MLIDLRSDTVTKPTKNMLEAMLQAPVGDDVFNEDPTVDLLEKKTAELFGMQSGLFCPSGTMANQIAIKAHTQPGDEVICDALSHIYHYEGGGISFHSGAQAKLIYSDRGRISAEQIEENINGDYDWLTKTSLVSLENTINKAGGSFYTLNQIKPIKDLCHNKKLSLHLDGARIFNALEETKETPSQTGQMFDSISVCLSKGLGAPVGSVLLGNHAFIKKARRIRKLFGGGMRQAGFLAAAGIYALDHHVKRLKEDHHKAKLIAETLNTLSYVKNCLPVETNIVIFQLADHIDENIFYQKLAENNIKASSFGKQTVRMVTHLDFTDDMLQVLLKHLKALS